MFYLNIILLLFSMGFGAIINVPADYPTIQEAIDAAAPGDEVLVDDGTYTENLLIENDLYLHSVNGANATIIDGSNGRGLGSTIVTRPMSNTTHQPIIEINGFSIKNGVGTEINREVNTPVGLQTITERVGGGLFVYVNSPKVNDSQFLNNGITTTNKGGAVFASSGGDDIGFPDRDHYQNHPDLEPAEGPLDFSNNTFLGNDAMHGHSIFIEGYQGTNSDLGNCFFDVYDSTFEGSSEYWIKGVESGFNESNGSGAEFAIVGDVYVAPNGNDNTNSGLSWQSPFQTISHALSLVYADSLNPATIFLAAGIYSPTSNGEEFPIEMIEYVNLIGWGEEYTIIDAEHTGKVITIIRNELNNFSGMTITGGYAPDEEWPQSIGGGIYCINSNPIFENVTITENTSTGDLGRGGGIYFDNSNPTLLDVTITNNTAQGIYYYPGGGGIYCWNSSAYLEDVTVTGNSADWGGGIQCYKNSDAELINVVINNNTAWDGGGLFIRESNLNLINLLIDGNYAGSSGGGIYCWNSNSVLENITITNNTAQFNGGGIVVEYGNPNLSNIIISDNYSGGSGGGLYCWHGEPGLTEIEIDNNIALHYGGGLYFRDASPILQNIIVSNNVASQSSGGGIYFWNSSTNLTNTTITGNSTPNWGGGITCDNCNVNLINTILWNDSPEEINIYSGSVSAIYSDIQGGWDGEGNINLNPQFTNLMISDYTLRENSPCIDAGTADLNGDGVEDITDYLGSAPDMGAYEYMGDILPGDINDDGLINVLDVVALVNIVLTGGEYNTAGDLNSDGVNNVLDVVFLVNIILNG